MSNAASGIGVITGIAALPIAILGACAYGAYKAAEMIKKVDERVLAILEKNRQDLEKQQVLATPNGLKSKFIKDAEKFRDSIKSFNLKYEEMQLYTHVYAMESSGLARFLSPSEQKLLMTHGAISAKDTLRQMNDAVTNFKTTTFDHAQQSIIEAARESGFNHKLQIKKTLIGTHITAINTIGQSIVVLTNSTNDGVKIHADLTGFNNGNCTMVMDTFINALSNRNICLKDLRRTEHMKSEGILNNYTEKKVKEISTPINEQTHQIREAKKSLLRRKRNIFYQNQKSKL
jgi:hypothetical protein